jgi:hypothetical protein
MIFYCNALETKMQKFILTLTSTVTFSIFSMTLVAAEMHCAKISVGSGKCPQVEVQIDLSACGEKLVGEPAISCSGNDIRIVAHSEEHEYHARFVGTEAWGAFTYSQSGGIERKAVNSTSKPEKIKKAPAISPVPTKPAPVVEKKEVVRPARHVEEVKPLTFGGNFDAFYGFNFNKPKSVTPAATLPTGNTGGGVRAFDYYHNQFALSLAELTVRKESKEILFSVDLDFGEAADTNAADEVSKHIAQANITYSPAKLSGWTFTFGKLLSHVGYEGYKAKDDWQYSRSITNFMMPAWHTGLAVGIPLWTDKLGASVYLYNGWNSLYDNNDGKTLGFQLKYMPTSDLTVTNNFIAGPEQANENGNLRIENEANIVWTVNSKLAFALEGLWGFEEEAISTDENGKWGGITAHMKVSPLNHYWISPRVEYYHDRSTVTFNGFTTGANLGNRIFAATLTNGFPIAAGFETRVEFRYDHAMDNPIFAKKSGLNSKNQFTSVIGVLYSF